MRVCFLTMVMLAGLMFPARIVNAANPITADEAIKEAITLLETRLANIQNGGDIAKLQSVIRKLKSAQESAPIARLSIGDFIDNTLTYKGQTITLELVIDDSGIRGEKSLRNYTGTAITFRTRGVEPELKIDIYIPKTLDVPKAVWNEMLVVTFRCKEGNLHTGNEANSIIRSTR